MILRRLYDDRLAQAAYLIGCAAAGEAVVVDPSRDVEPYLDAAAAEGLRIAHVTETHIHADFVSGARELATRTGARLYLSAEGGPDWQYRFAAEDGVVLLRHGDGFAVGAVRLDVLHTPGHTPEHLTFLVTDTATADRPIGALTGDFVFVGDVGRPDLLERVAGSDGSAEDAARALFRSLRRFKAEPDHLQIWPGHGAGSACGKGIGSVPSSTVGYERLFSWAFAHDDEDLFVRAVLEGQPDPPGYFARVKRINREGPPILGGLPRPPRLAPDRLAALLDRGSPVVDTRPAAAHAAVHIPGTVNIPLGRSFATWAGSLLPYETDLHLIVAESAAVEQAVRDLTTVGLDRIGGCFGTDVLSAWTEAGRDLSVIPQITAPELLRRLRSGGVSVVDVRNPSEWEAGHLPGARNLPLGSLAHRVADLDRQQPLVVHCQSGARSAIAASLLRARGLRDVANLVGGFAEWHASGLAIEHTGGHPEALQRP